MANNLIEIRRKEAHRFLSNISTVTTQATQPTVEDEIQIITITAQTILQEADTIAEKWLDGRVLITFNGCQLSLFSVIPIVEKLKSKRSRAKKFNSTYFDRVGLGIVSDKRKRVFFIPLIQKYESFAELLEPAHTLSLKSPLNCLCTHFKILILDNPYFVDDPEFQTGRNKTVITLPCFKGSIIQHCNASDVNKAQNEYFKERLPGLDSSITLGEIRDLKSRMVEVGAHCDLEISSIASAFVYLEKLIVSNYVNFGNRRVIAGCCIFLASKVNDNKELNYKKVADEIDKVLDVSLKDLYSNEFSVYCALEFALFIPVWDIKPHMSRILSQGDPDLKEYFEKQAEVIASYV